MPNPPKLEALPNLYGNPIAALDVETTGRICGFHEIVQIAIVPLTLELDIASKIRPFYHVIRPEYPERAEIAAMQTNGLDLDDLMDNAPSQERVKDYLLDWFSRLPLGDARRLTPLAHNWGFERSFLVPWLGPDLFHEVFTPLPRDTMTFALSINDRAAVCGREPPFKRVNLKYMCQAMGVPLTNAHDALADSIATAKLYAAMLRAVMK